MTEAEKKKKIFEFIKKHHLAVLSTLNESRPQAAVVGFSEKENFELFIGTFVTSRKYENLKKNNQVALVIGWDEGITVQYEGQIEEITNSDEIKEFKRIHTTKNPETAGYMDHPEERFLKVKPHWIRYSDLKFDPWEILEIRF